jgi:RHS repeat-associated protein
VVFDTLGRLQAAVDRNGNRDSVAYAGTTDTVTALVDPVGKRITFTYSSGRLTTITTLPGEAGERKTSVSIDATSNQLTYDSLSSPTAKPYTSRYVYQSYPGTKTSVLTQRIGVITDTTVVVYDSTFFRRPVQAKLPVVVDPATGSNAKPTITYTAMERRGYHGIVRVDSAGPYVEVKDPRGNWTRSWLNRWGQAKVSWDTLGLLSRASYADDGFTLWAEGRKTADTTRVRYAYNAYGFLTKSWIVRAELGGSILRVDSLVYDASDRVIRRIDSRGKIDSVNYDAYGNVIKAWDPAGNMTRTWYRSDGLVDSVAPAAGGVYRYQYETTWKQPAGTRLGPGSPGVLLDSTTYDAYGRATTSGLRKTRVAGTSFWQWRRTLPYYTVANQLDSVGTQLSLKCADPCNAPGTWGAVVDRAGTRFDRAGRDSLRVSPTGSWTLYLYDRLGRLLSRRPPSSAGTPPRDSMVYDLAGNVIKSITRLGDTIVSTYDSRNRDTSTVVPRYGTIKKQYGGSLYQLNRVWVTSLIDSIGGVNPEVRYWYDARGRLKADTAYAGTNVLTRTYAYDVYERDSAATDARGTWKTRYDADRGLPATLVTPFSDSLTFAFDGLGRLSQRKVLSSGPQVITGISFSSGGELQDLSTTVATGTPWNAGHYDATGWPADEGPPLGPTWSWQKGSGTGSNSVVDTIEVDAKERMVRWRQGADGDSASYDGQGNVLTAGGSEVYDTVSQRLSSRTENGGTWAYTYDAAGNQTQAQWTCGGCTTKTWVYGYNGLNQLISARYNGTLIARYGYDVLSRRIVKRVYNSSTGGTVEYRRFTYAGDHIAEVRDSAGSTWSWRYTWGNGADDLVGFTDGTIQYYVAQDKLGSIRAVWKRDGTWILSQRFTPYGKLLARDSAGAVPAGLRFSWTGREYDAETGLYYFRARYYETGQRRFTQEDPIGFGGGGNVYAYVDGAVTEARDPSGLLKDDEHFGGNPHDWSGVCFMFTCLNGNGSLGDMGGGGTWGERSSRRLQGWGARAAADLALRTSVIILTISVGGYTQTVEFHGTTPTSDACDVCRYISDGGAAYAGIALDAFTPIGGGGFANGVFADSHGWGTYTRGAGGLGLDFSVAVEAGYSENFWGWAAEGQIGIGPAAVSVSGSVNNAALGVSVAWGPAGSAFSTHGAFTYTSATYNGSWR